MPSLNKLNTIELNATELLLYSRHILLEGWEEDAQLRLKSSRVLMIGAGGIGATCAELLVRAGVGHLTIIDFDHIELSNLQRQLSYLPEHVGSSKVQTLVERLKNINPYVDISAIESKVDHAFMAQHHDQYDLVLDGCDNFVTRYLVNEYCQRNRIPLLSAAAIGLEGQLMFVKQQPCYACVFPQDDHLADARRCANSGVLTTTPVVIASLQAHHALLYLGTQKSPLLNKLLLWNGSTLAQRILNIQQDPACQCCNS